MLPEAGIQNGFCVLTLVNILMRKIRIVLWFLLVVAAVLAFMAACICWPTSTAEKMRIAAAMSAFCTQPHPRGILNDPLPALLAERDPQYYKAYPSNPAWEADPGSMSICYYYRRFGVDYEKNFRLFHRRSDDPAWTFTSEIRTRIFGSPLNWREQPISVSETQ
jgi:hypothetical protein